MHPPPDEPCPGIKLSETFKKDLDYHIFEKNADVGGTWLENTYPGWSILVFVLSSSHD